MPQDNSQPTSNPPGGGSWTWDSIQGAWAEKVQPAAQPESQTPASADTPATPE